MDRLDAMSILVASVESGSFSAASRKLGVPLPTISRKVSELEAHLNTRLLVRSTRKLALTEAGISYVDACKRILEEIQQAEAQVSGEYTAPRGELTITAPLVFGRLHVVPVVSEFLAQFAAINVRMVLSDRNVDLLDDHIDMAVRIGDLADSNLTATRVGTVRRVVCASPAYLKEHGAPTTPEDVLKHQCIVFAALASGTSWMFKSRGSKARSIQPVCRLQINTAESAIDAAMAGVGLTNVLSYQAARAVAEGKLKIILQDFEPPPIPVHLLHAHQKLAPLKMRRFLEFAPPRIRQSLLASQKALA
jgi:DNA-binding transcriptional LysR family regulator